MYVTLNSILITLLLASSLNTAFANTEIPEPPSQGLALLDSGETVYVTVRGNHAQSRRVRPGYMDLGRCYYARSRTCSKYLEAREENIVYPADSLTVNTQGRDRVIRAGEVILTHNNVMMAVIDVFTDGRIAALPVNVTRNPGAGIYRDWFRPVRRANYQIIHSDSIKAVATDQFGPYYSGDRLRGEVIEGVPLCEMHALRTFVRRQELVQEENETPCQHGLYYIQGMFTDGSFAKGSSVLNPFPPQLQNYINSEAWNQSIR